METSTDPDIAGAAAAMDAELCSFKRLRDNIWACRDGDELVKYGKAIVHLCIQSVKVNSGLLENFLGMMNFSQPEVVPPAMRSWLALAYHELKNTPESYSQRKHQVDVRTPRRLMAVHRLPSRFPPPDDENLV